MDNTWLTQAKRLQAIASTGLHFCRDEYDRERYQEIADIAHRMLAELGGVPPARILELVSDFAQGYATPKVDVRGALIEHDRILLVREKATAADAAGRLCRRRPVASRERDQGNPRRSGHRRVRHAPVQRAPQGQARIRARRAGFHKLFFLCARDGDERTPTPGLETMDADFFALRPAAAAVAGRVVESDIQAAFAFRADEARAAAFD